MDVKATIDTSRFVAASRELASFARSREPGEVLLRHVRGFVRRVVEITPPASAGTRGIAARRQGERAIDRDLGAVFVPVRLKNKRREQFPDVDAIYHREVEGRKGRTRIRPLREKYHVDRRKLETLRRRLYGLVGWLAGGWNAAAAAVGYNPPTYARRHGSARGQARVNLEGPSYGITVANLVGFVREAKDYPRRVQAALDIETASLGRQTEAILTRRARKAGFKVRGG